MHRVRTIIIGFGLAAACSACGPGSDSTVAEPTATVTVTATPSSPASTVATSSSATNAPETLPPPLTAKVVHAQQITSPTHNIRCSLAFGVDCSISQATYDPIPRPADCEFDWTDHWFTIGDTLGVRGSCRSDTPFTEDPVELAYGTTTVSKGVACQSQESGMICWDVATRHGFLISRGTYHLF